MVRLPLRSVSFLRGDRMGPWVFRVGLSSELFFVRLQAISSRLVATSTSYGIAEHGPEGLAREATQSTRAAGTACPKLRTQHARTASAGDGLENLWQVADEGLGGLSSKSRASCGRAAKWRFACGT